MNAISPTPISVSLARIPAFAFLVSGGLLIGALAFQYIGGMAPCQMCYWQRYAHYAILIIAIAAMGLNIVSKSHRKAAFFALVLTLAFAISAGLGFWHMGVEYGWWEGPKSCMAVPSTINPEDIFKALDGKAEMPSCGDAPWQFLGISMAGYNGIISAFAALVCAAGLKRKTVS